jgi:hypothetical protein
MIILERMIVSSSLRDLLNRKDPNKEAPGRSWAAGVISAFGRAKWGDDGLNAPRLAIAHFGRRCGHLE